MAGGTHNPKQRLEPIRNRRRDCFDPIVTLHCTDPFKHADQLLVLWRHPYEHDSLEYPLWLFCRLQRQGRLLYAVAQTKTRPLPPCTEGRKQADEFALPATGYGAHLKDL